jgi:hypothetical protein
VLVHAHSQNCERRPLALPRLSVHPSIRMEQLGSHCKDFIKFGFWKFFENLLKKFKFLLKSDKTNGHFTRRPLYIFFTISRSILLRMRNFSEKESCRENQTAKFVFSFFFNCAFDRVMWKNTVEPDRLQMTIWRMRSECWIHRTTYPHSQFVILIPFPLQQQLHERSIKLRCTYIASLFCNGIPYILESNPH